MPDPTPVRQRLREFPTPRTQDFLFAEMREVSRHSDSPTAGTEQWVYGTAHPNTTRWPNHKLCFVEDADAQGLWQKWWYIADRESQETYNYSIEYVGGDIRYPRVTRTFIVPRGTEPLEMGSSDPHSPFDDQYTYQQYGDEDYTYVPYNATPDPTGRYYQPAVGSGVLVFQSEKPIEGKIGTLYVEQTRVYEVIPGVDDAVPGSGFTQRDSGYMIERPLGTSSFIRLTWKITLPRTIADGNIQANFAACPIAGYTTLMLVNETVKASEEDNQKATVIRVFEGNVVAPAFPSSEAVVGSLREYPGAIPPDKFLSVMTQVSSTTEESTPEGVTLVATAPSSYTLTKVEVKPDDVLRGKKTVTYVSFTLTTLSGKRWDTNLMAYVPYTIRMMTPAEAAALTVTAGQEISIKEFSTFWSVVTTETPTPTTVSYLGAGGNGVSYYKTIPFSWPAVLESLTWGVVDDQIHFDYYITPSWSGLCKARVEVAYYATNPINLVTDIPVQQLIPTSVRLSYPGLASLNLPPCLHPELEFYASGFPDVVIPATNGKVSGDLIVWPDSLVAHYDVEKYLGGYIVKQITVEKPAESTFV